MWRLFNSMRDMYSNVTLILTAVIIIVLTQVNPPAKTAEATKPPGTISVVIAWPAGNTDVDLWVMGPGQPIATGYSSKTGKLFSLLRDDMGTVNDSSSYNMENAYARDTPAGDYAINIHGYSISADVPVHIEVAINSSLLVNTDMVIKPRQERTVVRFKLDADGRVVSGSLNSVFIPLRSVK